MSEISSYEKELDVLEKGARLTFVTPVELLPQNINVISISPGTWIEDPYTGANELIRYWYKADISIPCPSCHNQIPEPLFIKTKKHLIIYCSECERYTFLKVSRAQKGL